MKAHTRGSSSGLAATAQGEASQTQKDMVHNARCTARRDLQQPAFPGAQQTSVQGAA